MKPLTVKELKALEVGDWVWITTTTNKGEYYQIGYSDYLEDENAFVAYSLHYELNVFYSDYGTKWTAYKNKELAEAPHKLYYVFDFCGLISITEYDITDIVSINGEIKEIYYSGFNGHTKGHKKLPLKEQDWFFEKLKAEHYKDNLERNYR